MPQHIQIMPKGNLCIFRCFSFNCCRQYNPIASNMKCVLRLFTVKYKILYSSPYTLNNTRQTPLSCRVSVATRHLKKQRENIDFSGKALNSTSHTGLLTLASKNNQLYQCFHFRHKTLPILHPEIIKQRLVIVLRSQASVKQITTHPSPLLLSALIEHLQFVGNNKRHNTVGKTLLEHHKTPYSSVAILERMDDL